MHAAMVRFVRAVDGQTIVVDRNGTQVLVTLAGVQVAAEDQQAARTFLEHELTGSWLLVEGTDHVTVYRSPDGAQVNQMMQQRGYAENARPHERYLGEGFYEPRKPTAAPAKPAGRTHRRTSRRSSASRLP